MSILRQFHILNTITKTDKQMFSFLLDLQSPQSHQKFHFTITDARIKKVICLINTCRLQHIYDGRINIPKVFFYTFIRNSIFFLFQKFLFHLLSLFFISSSILVFGLFLQISSQILKFSPYPCVF